MYKGISNSEIEKALKKLNNDDIDKDIIGVFSSDKMNKFINFHLSMKVKDSKYLFLISNTDRYDRKETHWWGILDIYLKTDIFFFDLFGVAGLKHFIIQDDKDI